MRYPQLILFLTALVCFSNSSFSQTALSKGSVRNLDEPIRFQLAEFLSTGTVWNEPLPLAGIEESLIHFRFDSIPEGNISLILRGPDFIDYDRINLSEMEGSDEYWSLPVKDQNVSVRVLVEELPVSGVLSFEIDRLAIKEIEPTERLLSVIGDIDFDHLYTFANNSALISAAKAVGLVEYVEADSWNTCTGYLVSEDLFITNEHCLSSAREDQCLSSFFKFGYEYKAPDEEFGNRDWILAEGDSYRCSEVIYSDLETDWSLVRLLGKPGIAQRWGFLEVDFREPESGESLALIHHPAGNPKYVTERNCIAQSIPAPGRVLILNSDFGHTCDSLKGSSGSPLLSAQFKVIGTHHWGTIEGDPRWEQENRAVLNSSLCRPTLITRDLVDWPAC